MNSVVSFRCYSRPKFDISWSLYTALVGGSNSFRSLITLYFETQTYDSSHFATTHSSDFTKCIFLTKHLKKKDEMDEAIFNSIILNISIKCRRKHINSYFQKRDLNKYTFHFVRGIFWILPFREILILQKFFIDATTFLIWHESLNCLISFWKSYPTYWK